jgi:predicted transcriptional regulator with HTH domain
MIDEQTNTPDNDSGIDNDSGSDVGSSNEASYYLRDLTEDDVYSRLQQAGNFPGHLTGLESRFNGNFSQVQERLAGLEKSLGAQTSFDFSKLQKVLADYDPKLAEILVPALTDAIKVAPLDDTVFRPHLDSISNKLTDQNFKQYCAYLPDASLAAFSF